VQGRAELAVSASMPGLTLPERPGERWRPSGMLAMTLEATGTLAAPRASLAIDATGLKLGGLPFGDLKGTARTAGEATLVDLTLASVEGGTIRCQGSIGATPGIRSPLAALLAAPLRIEVTGHDMSAAFLPSLLPGRVRSVSGTMQASLSVTGSAAAPSLAGTLVLAGGKLTLPGWGTVTDIGFEAAFDPRRIRLQGLTLRRGAGRVEGELQLDGLGGAEARLGGGLRVTGFSLARGGMDVATIDARAALGGRYRAGRLEIEVTIDRGGTVRLPRKAPRTLQPIGDRPDIVIGEAPARPAGGAAGAEGAEDAAAVVTRPALAVTIQVRGEELLLKSDQPRVNVALRTDSTWEVTASPLQVGGTLEAYQGNFEPLAGRLFKVVRGRIGFPGGKLGDAELDLAADYENPSAKVHATVSGTLEKPNLRLTSEPPLDEASLAMLIVTGRTDVTVGGTPGSAFSAQDAGMAAAMAVANKAFEEQLGEKMPVDSLTLDSSAVTAAKQLTDRILVSYIRRFDARPDKGENVDEVRVQYHMTTRWTLETRYGNAGAGGASVIWQKDY
jgi:translocation and assembly module TamB